MTTGLGQARQPHPIELESYAILRSRVDLSPMPPLWRAVAERVIHASADLEYAVDLVTDERHLQYGLTALRAGVPVVCDVPTVAAGITERETLCPIGDPATPRMAKAANISHAAAAVRVAYSEVVPERSGSSAAPRGRSRRSSSGASSPAWSSGSRSASSARPRPKPTSGPAACPRSATSAKRAVPPSRQPHSTPCSTTDPVRDRWFRTG